MHSGRRCTRTGDSPLAPHLRDGDMLLRTAIAAVFSAPPRLRGHLFFFPLKTARSLIGSSLIPVGSISRKIGPEGLPEISRGRKPPDRPQRCFAPAGAVEISSAQLIRMIPWFRSWEIMAMPSTHLSLHSLWFSAPRIASRLSTPVISAAPPGRLRSRWKSGGFRPRLISGRPVRASRCIPAPTENSEEPEIAL